MTKVIAIDVGYSATKTMMEGRKAIIPSVVGTPMPEESFSLSNGTVAIKAGAYFVPVGLTAFEQSQYVSSRRDPEWVLGETWDTLFKAGVWEVMNVPYADVNVVTGLPVADWGSFGELLKLKLQNSFVIDRYGHEKKTIKVRDVSVPTQPFGTMLDMALNENGKQIENEFSRGYAGVIDIGGNTVNFLVANKLTTVRPLTSSNEFGLLKALDNLRQDIRVNYRGLKPDTHEVSEWVAKGCFRYKGKDIDIWQYADKHFNPLVESLANEVVTRWPETGKFDAVLLSGGGASAIGQRLIEKLEGMFAKIIIADDSRWANVRGYYKWGLFKFGGE